MFGCFGKPKYYICISFIEKKKLYVKKKSGLFRQQYLIIYFITQEKSWRLGAMFSAMGK